MKNYLILYLILFNFFSYGQNNSNFHIDLAFNESSQQSKNPKFLSRGILVPIESASGNLKSNKWLLSDNNISSSISTKEFSSMTLIEHLQQLDHSTPFNVGHNATIERFIRVYLQNNRENLGRLIGKSNYYFPVFEQYLDRYELPIELKYLAVVESALNQEAVSASGAKGLWQFMYGTGKEYGLYIDSYVDERFDMRKSTEAACAYLHYLHKTFNDWDLALAAYNSGPGNVKKAIKRAGGNRNYWEIRKYLPRETSSYVPAFYATMYLFSYADFHSLNGPTDEFSYALIDTLQVKGSLSFSAISKVTGIDSKSIRTFNPQYKKDHIPQIHNKTFSLNLPVDLIPAFLHHEDELYRISSTAPNKVSTSQVIKVTLENSYLVKQGDNLQRIANLHGIGLDQLKKWNGLETNFLIAGQRLVVTNRSILPSTSPVPSDFSESRSTQIVENGSDFTTYVVQNGDTLFQISRKFGNIPITEIKTLNKLENINYLKPGRQLKIKLNKGTAVDLSVNKS